MTPLSVFIRNSWGRSWAMASLFLLIIASPSLAAPNSDPARQATAPAAPAPVEMEKMVIVVQKAVLSAFHFGYDDYRRELDWAKPYFTPSGWAGYEAALKASGNLAEVIRQKMAMRAVAKRAPVYRRQESIRGERLWVFEMPITVTFQTTDTKHSKDLDVRVILTRTNRGYAVESLVAS